MSDANSLPKGPAEKNLPSFHGQRIKVYGELISNIVKNKLSNWKNGDTLKLVDQARDITFGIILGAVFGVSENNIQISSLTKSLHALIHVFSMPCKSSNRITNGILKFLLNEAV